MTLILLAAVLIGLIPAAIARNKGRSFVVWWLYGAALWIVAFPHALLINPDCEELDRRAYASGMRRCARCMEWVQGEAKACRFCGATFESIGEVPTASSTSIDASIVDLPKVNRRWSSIRTENKVAFACLVFASIIFVIYLFLDDWRNNLSRSINASQHSASESSNVGMSDDPKKCLVLRGHYGIHNEYSTTITGAVENDCGRGFSYVQITFTLLDRYGNVVGNALANQSDLKAGETWSFRAVGASTSNSQRLAEITAY